MYTTFRHYIKQCYYSTLPLADPSLIVTSTITSLDVLLLSVIVPVNELLLSAIEYCDWPSDTVAPVDQMILTKLRRKLCCLPSLSLIITSTLLILPIVTPHVVTDIIAILNVSLHSTILLSPILKVNDCNVTPVGTLTVTGLPL